MIMGQNMLRNFFKTVLTFLCISLTSCSGGGNDGATSISPKILVSGANFPVGIAVSDDGTAFYTELHTGNVRRIVDGVLAEEPVINFAVSSTGNEGVLGIALSPNFNQDRLLYVFVSRPNSGDNAVFSYVVPEGEGDFPNLPSAVVQGLPIGGHNGGRIAFGPDGKMYVSTGDAANPAAAQDLKSLKGKILRYNQDGTIPNDNPIAGSPVYALGLRNVFGMSFDSQNGKLFTSDNGPSCDDEVNLISKLGNYGWKNGQPCGDQSNLQPLSRLNPPVAPTGLAVYRGSRFSDLDGTILLGTFLTKQILKISQDTGEVLGDLFPEDFGPVIDVTTSPDGRIYFATENAIGVVE